MSHKCLQPAWCGLGQALFSDHSFLPGENEDNNTYTIMCEREAPNTMLDTQNSFSTALETNMVPSSWNDHFTTERTVVNSIRRENIYSWEHFCPSRVFWLSCWFVETIRDTTLSKHLWKNVKWLFKRKLQSKAQSRYHWLSIPSWPSPWLWSSSLRDGLRISISHII